MRRLVSVRQIINMARPYNALLPGVAVVVGYGSVGGNNVGFLLLTILALVLLHSAITLWNDLEDIAVDELNGRKLSANVSIRGLKWACVGLLATTAGVSLFLPLETTVVLALLLVCAWAYNALPLRMSRRPIGSMVTLFFAYGILPFSLGVTLVDSSPSIWVLLLGFSLAAGRVSLSILKDYKDAPGDAQFGKRTFLLTYGATKVRWVSVALAFEGYVGSLIALQRLGLQMSTLIALAVIAAWLIKERWELRPRNKSYGQLNDIFHRCLHYQLLFDGLVALWLTT